MGKEIRGNASADIQYVAKILQNKGLCTDISPLMKTIALLKGSKTAQLEKLREYILDHEGSCPVFLHIKDAGKETVVQANHQIKVKSDFDMPEESELRQFVTDFWKE